MGHTAQPTTSSFITGSVGSSVRGENRLVKFEPGFDGWGPEMNRNLELISQGLQFAGNVKDYQMSGTLDFGQPNIWMTRSQVITFHPTSALYQDAVDPVTGTPGLFRIPIFQQVENGSQQGPGASNDFANMNHMIKQVTFSVVGENAYTAGNTWRFRVFHTSSTSGEVRVMSYTQARSLNAYEPFALMQYSDAFQLSGSEVHNLFLQINKQAGTPPPLKGAVIKVTYCVANDTSTFEP